MNTLRSLWTSVTANPTVMRRVNGWATIFWIVMIPISIATGWISSVTYIAALSIWALVSGHWSAWEAARVEERQQAIEEAEQERPIEQRVVEQIVEQTEVRPSTSTGP